MFRAPQKSAQSTRQARHGKALAAVVLGLVLGSAWLRKGGPKNQVAENKASVLPSIIYCISHLEVSELTSVNVLILFLVPGLARAQCRGMPRRVPGVQGGPGEEPGSSTVSSSISYIVKV